MRAVVFSRNGGPEVLEHTEVPDPNPGEGDVLVEVPDPNPSEGRGAGRGGARRRR
jgi:hypothetical protein